MQSLKLWTEACWDGYKQIGMKKKGKRKVPNCVPEEDEVQERAKGTASPKELKKQADMMAKMKKRQGRREEDETPPGYHRMPDGSIMKDDEMEENAAMKRRAKKAAYAKKTMKKYGDACLMGMDPADVNQRRNKPTLKKR